MLADQRRAPRLRQQIEMRRALESQTGLRQRPAVEDEPLGFPAIPGHDLLGFLGQGTMGTVYLARQTGVDRLVAVKILHGGAHAAPDALAHFRFEVETLGGLAHPNIVEIHGSGTYDGRVFCALEYVGGGDLRYTLDGDAQPARRSATLIKELAFALDSVHRLGVVHRDLKPANILLTADGQPKIADFGLAERFAHRSPRTSSGEIVGTPSYMAPEQTDPACGEIGPATDLYALGAILYVLMTGRPPIRGRDVVDTVRQIRTAAPIPPSRLRLSIPRDLEAICLKCLEKEPSRRYVSAAELACELEAFLARERRARRSRTSPCEWRGR